MGQNLKYIVTKQSRIIREQEKLIRALNETIQNLVKEAGEHHERIDYTTDPCFTCDQVICNVNCPYYDDTEL